MTKEEILDMARTAGFNPKSMFMELKLKRFAELVEQRKVQEISKSCGLLPFGDTAHSFAVWISEQ